MTAVRTTAAAALTATLGLADGAWTLAELFDGRSQLVVYHFMFGPDYEAGCPTCSSARAAPSTTA
jgi:predicted dithiol-disulfide oxidoreductase (DUF899 family)